MLVIQVFISHSQNDENLAVTLKGVLEESNEINAFMFEQKKRYGIQIIEKITCEIDEADYLVAIITQNTQESASVNQELGYAQGRGIEKIAMVEDKTKKGFMIYGSECCDFSKTNFKDKCVEIRKYILNEGLKYTRDRELVLESAYYRKVLERAVCFFLNSTYYRFNVGGNYMPGSINYDCIDESKEYIMQIEKFFNRDDGELINHMLKMDFEMYAKLDSELMLCKEQITDAERFPHSKLTQKEKDPITELEESIRYMNDNDLNIGKYCEDNYNQKPSLSFRNYYLMKQFNFYKSSIQQDLGRVLDDIRKIIFSMTKLAMIFMEYREVFGGIAFKSTA